MKIAMNTHLPPPEFLDLAIDAGISEVRFDFNWFMMEPKPSEYDWLLTDRAVQAAVDRKLFIYPTLAYTPAWVALPGKNTVPSWDYWYGFTRAVVNRYKPYITHWSLWNEPNSEGFWNGSVEEYINIILDAGSKAIRDEDPNAKVVGPDLATEGDWQPWLAKVLDEAKSLLDILAVHSYQDNGREVLRRIAGPTQIWNRPTVTDLMARYDWSDRELWITETGWKTSRVGEETQASYYDQLFESWHEYPQIQRIYFYQLIDEYPPDGEPETAGIFREDRSPKPAVEICRRWAQIGEV